MSGFHRNGKDRPRLVYRRVQRDREQGAVRLTVLCTHRARVIDARDCRTCEHGRGLSIDPDNREVFVRCAPPPWGEGADDPSDQRSNPTPLTAIVAPGVTGIAEDECLPAALALFAQRGLDAAPVVDADGRPVGIVTKADLARAHGRRVREVMSHAVFCLHAEADVSRAAALMAYEGVHHVVITAQDGRALGVVSALDVLRWLARRSGYVVPAE